MIKPYSFIEQMEENTKFNLTFPYHIVHENLLGNLDFNIKYPDSYHCHSFEEVLRVAYMEPKAFYLTEEDQRHYSNQEILFINKVIEDEIKKVDNGMVVANFDLDEDTLIMIEEYKAIHNLTFEESVIDILKKIIDNPEVLKENN